jgi:hypothetical protein
MSVERAILNLQREQAELAASALRSPSSRDAFEYGRMVGMYAGIERAIAVLMSTITAEDNDV